MGRNKGIKSAEGEEYAGGVGCQREKVAGCKPLAHTPVEVRP